LFHVLKAETKNLKLLLGQLLVSSFRFQKAELPFTNSSDPKPKTTKLKTAFQRSFKPSSQLVISFSTPMKAFLKLKLNL
jgi:hypothetical protein